MWADWRELLVIAIVAITQILLFVGVAWWLWQHIRWPF